VTRLFEAKPFVIAEVGSSWRTLNDCIQSIGVAKAVGADACKFQAFTHNDLYGLGEKPWPHVPGESPYLDVSWLPALKEKADACGIELMCTAFSPELVAAVDPFVTVHKVASSDLSWPQLLQAVARTGKPVLLSTGASSVGDIQAALLTMAPAIFDKVLLYCVAAYPALQVDLSVMHQLQKLAGEGMVVGFSDHTPGITVAVEACRQGARVLEKHFTAFPDLESPDRGHSLTPDEFKLMVDHIRGVRKPTIGPTPEERDMLLRHNRRLLATRDVKAGEVLRYGENFGAYRSLVDDTRGLSPFAWESVEGRTARVDIGRGTGIGPGDFG